MLPRRGTTRRCEEPSLTSKGRSRDLGIAFERGGGTEVLVTQYVDPDYADKANNRRSASGVTLKMGKANVNASKTIQQ